MENYDKNHYNKIMENIFNKTKDIFLNKKYHGYFNILLTIASKNNSNFIIKFLNLVKEEMNKKFPTIFKNCKKLIPYLLDTCYQAYLIKYSKQKNIEFNPGFDLDETKDQNEKDKIIDDILSLSSGSLQKIFILDIYKLDYLMTWSKYYYNLEETENKYKCVRKFIFDYFLKLIIGNKISSPNLKNIFGEILYLINITFEYMAYHRINGFETKGKLKTYELLFQQLCPSFAIILFNEIQKEEATKELTREKVEEDSIYRLHERWAEFDIIFFIKVNEIEFFKKNINNSFDCNKGMELAIIKFHYYTLVLNVITDSGEFRNILNKFRYFILIIIIASTTVNIVYPKNANIKSEFDTWPNELEYSRLQHLVQNLLYNVISFLKDKIIEMGNKLEQYKSKLMTQKTNNFMIIIIQSNII